MQGSCTEDNIAAEYEDLIPPLSPASEKASMREVFGATEDDISRLRIVSLQEVRSTSPSPGSVNLHFSPLWAGIWKLWNYCGWLEKS